jgi:C1A family cysteine protease
MDIETVKFCDWREDVSQYVMNQGRLGACTATIASAYLCHLMQKNGISDAFVPSRLYIYWNARVLISGKSHDRDTGVSMEDTCKAICEWGICPERFCIYDVIKFWRRPSSNAYDYAKDFKKTVATFSYETIAQDEKIICDKLIDGELIMCSISMFESFRREIVAITAIVPLPRTIEEKFIEDHSLLLVGFNRIKQHFIAMNSWGKEWGNDGFCYIPFNYILNDLLCRDFCLLQMKKLK